MTSNGTSFLDPHRHRMGPHRQYQKGLKWAPSADPKQGSARTPSWSEASRSKPHPCPSQKSDRGHRSLSRHQMGPLPGQIRWDPPARSSPPRASPTAGCFRRAGSGLGMSAATRGRLGTFVTYREAAFSTPTARPAIALVGSGTAVENGSQQSVVPPQRSSIDADGR